jgi:hypothetical protein
LLFFRQKDGPSGMTAEKPALTITLKTVNSRAGRICSPLTPGELEYVFNSVRGQKAEHTVD